MSSHLEPTTTGAQPATEELRAARGHGTFGGIRVAAVVLLALGVAVLVGSAQVPSPVEGWDVAGPRFVPLVVGIGLTLGAVLFALRTVVRRDEDLAEYVAAENARTTWPPPLLMLGALVVFALVMPRLGWALATTLFVLAGARILGSRDPLRDGIVGVALGILSALLFGTLLGVPLPAGRLGV